MLQAILAGHLPPISRSGIERVVRFTGFRWAEISRFTGLWWTTLFGFTGFRWTVIARFTGFRWTVISRITRFWWAVISRFASLWLVAIFGFTGFWWAAIFRFTGFGWAAIFGFTGFRWTVILCFSVWWATIGGLLRTVSLRHRRVLVAADIARAGLVAARSDCAGSRVFVAALGGLWRVDLADVGELDGFLQLARAGIRGSHPGEAKVRVQLMKCWYYVMFIFLANNVNFAYIF